MSAILKDKFFGLTIGCAIGDCMGSVADILLQEGSNESVEKPTDGYWHEATALLVCQHRSLMNNSPLHTELQHMLQTGDGTSDGELTNISSRTLSVAEGGPSDPDGQTQVCMHETDCLLLMSAMAMHYYRDYETGYLAAYNNEIASGCRLCMDACKFYYSILDLALHGGNKKQILSPRSYANLVLRPEIMDLLNMDSDMEIFNLDGCDNVLSCLQMVLFVFSYTDNTEEGLRMIVNNSLAPVRTGAILGQLCGAYYGLTDIKEDWLDVIQAKEIITNMTRSKIDRVKHTNEQVRPRTKGRAASDCK